MKIGAVLASFVLLAMLPESSSAEVPGPRPHYSFQAHEQADMSFAAAQIYAERSLGRLHAEISRIFGVPGLPPVEVFYFPAEGAPEFVSSGLFVPGQIFLGLYSKQNSAARVERILRHELVHAALHHLSGGNCPAWLDEGLALYLEGINDESKRKMQDVLRRWLETDNVLLLQDLDRSYHTLPPAFAKVAYAESYLAVRRLIYRAGLGRVLQYVRSLSPGASELAFETHFGLSMSELEGELGL